MGCHQEGIIYTLYHEAYGCSYGYYAKGHVAAQTFLEMINTQRQPLGAVPGYQLLQPLVVWLPHVEYGYYRCVPSPHDAPFQLCATTPGPGAFPVTRSVVKPAPCGAVGAGGTHAT
ncbi:MAG: hypothetical protein HC828_05990 [Blastochloris sp.]|nr:hypothetical protein [Blastochloris sp.]